MSTEVQNFGLSRGQKKDRRKQQKKDRKGNSTKEISRVSSRAPVILPGTTGAHHPILHGQPFAPPSFRRLDFVFGRLAQRPQEGGLLVGQHIVGGLGRCPSRALGREEVIDPLLLVDTAHARLPVIPKEGGHGHGRVLRRDNQPPDIGTERDEGRGGLGVCDGRVGTLAGQTDIDKGRHGLHDGGMLAAEEVLHAALIVRVPASRVDPTKLAVMEGLRIYVNQAIHGTVLTPIRGAFSLSLDRSWGYSETVRKGTKERRTYCERDRENKDRVGPWESFANTLFRNPAET